MEAMYIVYEIKKGKVLCVIQGQVQWFGEFTIGMYQYKLYFSELHRGQQACYMQR